MLAALAPAGAFAGESRNLTESNRRALASKVDELQHSELIRLTHGRPKANPIPFPLHTIYQTALQNQELLIRNQSESFANALARLGKVFENYPVELETAAGRAAEARFKAEIIRLYDLAEPLSDSTSLLEVYSAFENSGFGMEAVPARAALALNAVRWLSKDSENGEPPPDAAARLDTLMRRWKPAADVFQMDAGLRSLSSDYAQLFLSVAVSRQEK